MGGLTGQAEALSDALGPIGALSVTALAQDVATLGAGLGSASEAARPLIVAMVQRQQDLLTLLVTAAPSVSLMSWCCPWSASRAPWSPSTRPSG